MRCHYPHLCCSCLCPSTYLYCLPRFLARFFPCPCAVHPHSFNPSMRRCLITFVAHNLTLSRRLSPPSLLPSSLSSCYLFNPSYTAFPPSYTLSCSSLRPLVLPLSFPAYLPCPPSPCPSPPDTVRRTASTSSGTKRAQTSTTFSTQSRRAWHHTGQRVSSVSAESSALWTMMRAGLLTVMNFRKACPSLGLC